MMNSSTRLMNSGRKLARHCKGRSSSGQRASEGQGPAVTSLKKGRGKERGVHQGLVWDVRA